MPSKRDEIDSFAVIRAFDYQKARIKERERIRKGTAILGKNLVDFIFKDIRGETSYNKTIEEYFVQSIQNTAADPEKNDDLIRSIEDIIYQKMYRVEHPRLKQLLQLNYEANLMRAIGGHSQIEFAISNETEVQLTKKTRIHTFINSLKKAFGKGDSDEQFWTS